VAPKRAIFSESNEVSSSFRSILPFWKSGIPVVTGEGVYLIEDAQWENGPVVSLQEVLPEGRVQGKVFETPGLTGARR